MSAMSSAAPVKRNASTQSVGTELSVDLRIMNEEPQMSVAPRSDRRPSRGFWVFAI